MLSLYFAEEFFSLVAIHLLILGRKCHVDIKALDFFLTIDLNMEQMFIQLLQLFWHHTNGIIVTINSPHDANDGLILFNVLRTS